MFGFKYKVIFIHDDTHFSVKFMSLGFSIKSYLLMVTHISVCKFRLQFQFSNIKDCKEMVMLWFC